MATLKELKQMLRDDPSSSSIRNRILALQAKVKAKKAPVFLKEGDIIELTLGMSVNATVPEIWLYSNGKANKTTHGSIKISAKTKLAGRYVVFKTAFDGGGTGHGPHDVFPDGHHVYCERLDDLTVKVDFYQSGCFTSMLPDLKPVGKARREWVVINALK